MKLIQASLLGVVLTATAVAQHGGGHAASGHASGGFSNFSSPSGRSFSMSAPAPSRTFNSASAYRPNAISSPYRSNATPAPFGGTQPPGRTTTTYSYRYNGYRPYYSRGVYLVPGYIGYGFGGYGYGYADDAGYSEQPQSAAPPADVYAQAPPAPEAGYEQAYGDVPARPAYQPGAPAAPDLPEQPEVTLLFKDGRPPVLVQNYAVTRTTLYVLDGPRRREIPLDQLDLPQTEKTNREAGVDFDVPSGD